ncbi:MAG TPA: hypothetical protein VFK52_02135 [Nocardioidaceae bacterium]|nr:hypothetical protein [Nocardioidaceae bacterium]
MTYEPPPSGRSRALPFVPIIGGVVAVVAGIAVVVFLVNQLSDVDVAGPGPGSVTTSPTVPVERQADVLSAAGFQDLVAAVKEQTGTTKVFDATLYPTYAVLQLPVDWETQRQQSFYWDGKVLRANESFGKSSGPRLDLTTVSVDGMLRLVRMIRNVVEEPTSWYVIVNSPDDHDPAVMYAYASNKFTEGGYISATADGKVIRRVTW